MTPTTRKYPRTLQEAFPKSYPQWYSHFKPRHHRTTAVVCFLSGFAAGFLFAWRIVP